MIEEKRIKICLYGQMADLITIKTFTSSYMGRIPEAEIQLKTRITDVPQCDFIIFTAHTAVFNYADLLSLKRKSKHILFFCIGNYYSPFIYYLVKYETGIDVMYMPDSDEEIHDYIKAFESGVRYISKEAETVLMDERMTLYFEKLKNAEIDARGLKILISLVNNKSIADITEESGYARSSQVKKINTICRRLNVNDMDELKNLLKNIPDIEEYLKLLLSLSVGY